MSIWAPSAPDPFLTELNGTCQSVVVGLRRVFNLSGGVSWVHEYLNPEFLTRTLCCSRDQCYSLYPSVCLMLQRPTINLIRMYELLEQGCEDTSLMIDSLLQEDAIFYIPMLSYSQFICRYYCSSMYMHVCVYVYLSP